MKKLKAFLFKGNKRNRKKNLLELDGLYKKSVSSFPIDEKRKYCQRLIARLDYELQNDRSLNEEQKMALYQLLQAAKLELDDIGPDSK